MTMKTASTITQAAINNAMKIIQDMGKTQGDHYIIEFIFNRDEDSLTTKLIDVTKREK